MADGDVFVTTTAEGVLKRSDIDAVTSRLKELGVISGRNIVKNSYPDKDTTEYLVAQLDYTEELDVNDIITITFFGELGSQKEKLMAIHGGGDGTRGTATLSKIADGMYRGTLTVKKTDGFGYMNIYASPSSVVDTTTVRCVMVERGKTGSQMWTPAPEDVADLLAKSGGVKSTFPTCYTSYLQSAEKGVQHERQSNGADRSQAAFISAECSDKANNSARRIEFKYDHSARVLSDSKLGNRKSSPRHVEICNARSASRILPNAHDCPDAKSVPFHSFADERSRRLLDKVDKVLRRISLTPGKEVVAA